MQEKTIKKQISIEIKEKNCIMCDKVFMPGWINDKYCEECKVKAKKHQDLLANRRRREKKKLLNTK